LIKFGTVLKAGSGRISSMATDKLVEKVLGIVAIGLLAVACLLVIQPFMSALMFAAILCYSTWPVYA
jgi:predicted PurR-regulated permease PerM